MKKVASVILLCVLLSLSMSLPVFAAGSNEVFHLRSLEVFEGVSGSDGEWVEKAAAWDTSQGLLHQTDTSTQQYVGWYGWRAEFYTMAYVKVTEGQYFLFTVSLNSLMPDYSTTGLPSDRYLTCKITNSNGIVYELEPYLELDEDGFYNCTFAAQIGEGEAFSFGDVVFESNLSPETVKEPYEIYMTFSIQAKLTPEQQRHEELMDKIDENTDKILNDDLGYQEDEDQAAAKDGIQGITEKIESLSADIDKSVASFSSSIDGIGDSIATGKTFIWGWLDYVPPWFTAMIVAFGGILIARKIVK